MDPLLNPIRISQLLRELVEGIVKERAGGRKRKARIRGEGKG